MMCSRCSRRKMKQKKGHIIELRLFRKVRKKDQRSEKSKVKKSQKVKSREKETFLTLGN